MLVGATYLETAQVECPAHAHHVQHFVVHKLRTEPVPMLFPVFPQIDPPHVAPDVKHQHPLKLLPESELLAVDVHAEAVREVDAGAIDEVFGAFFRVQHFVDELRIRGRGGGGEVGFTCAFGC